jgi:hypothetical protein
MRVEADTAGVDQYNRKMKEAEKTTQDVGKASKGFGDQIQGLNNTFSTFMGAGILGFGLGTLKGFAEEMYNAGTVSNQTAAIFEQMISPMTSVEDMMTRLREATLGMASDTDIQTGANLLLRMGIAENPEELEQIIGLVTRLKSPTEDLGSAINNFGLMMANQSVMRLDSFGLSSGRVRDRIEELIASGQALNREEAFKMATLEEGARAVERLGDAATVSVTAVGRLQVQIENLASQAAEQFAISIESIVGMAQVAAGVHPVQMDITKQRLQIIKEMTDQVFDDLGERSIMERLAVPDFETAAPDSFITDYLQQAIALAAEDPSLINNINQLRTRTIERLNWGQRYAAESGRFDMQIDAMNMMVSRAGDLLRLESEREERARSLEGLQNAVNRSLEFAQDLYQAGADEVNRQIQARDDEMNLFRLGRMEAQAMSLALNEMGEVPRFMDRESADSLSRMAEETQRIATDMKEAADADPLRFTDEQVKAAQDTAKAVGEMAKDAEAAARAFENIKLSDIFGQGGDSLIMDINRAIMGALPEGTTDEQRAAIERQLRLTSGEETESSLYFQEQLIPGILAQSDDPEVIAAASQALADIFKAATLEGVDTGDLGFLTAIENALSPENLQAFDAEAFVSAFQEAQTGAEGIDTGLSNAATSLEVSGRASADLATNLELGNKSSSQIAGNLRNAFDRRYTLNVDINAIAPPWLRTVLNDPSGASFAAMMERNTKDNGGKPPGMVP